MVNNYTPPKLRQKNIFEQSSCNILRDAFHDNIDLKHV